MRLNVNVCRALSLAVVTSAMAACMPASRFPGEARVIAPGRHPEWIMKGIAPNLSVGLQSPTLHDAQKIIEAGQYGAFFRATITEWTGKRDLSMDPIHVATVVVDSTPPMGSHYHEGSTCVYLSKVEERYLAMLSEGNPATFCKAASDAYDTLRVDIESYPEDEAQLAPTVRWHTRRDGTGLFLGVTCDPGWCVIGLEHQLNFEDVQPQDLFSDRDAHLLPGRYDEQVLAMMRGNVLVPSGMRARLYPRRGLERVPNEAFDDWTHVATVELQDGDSEELEDGLRAYGLGWELRWPIVHWKRIPDPGQRFRVEVRRKDGKWEGRYRRKKIGLPVVTSDTARVTYVPKPPSPPGVITIAADGPPGSVRWGWAVSDETIWVRCATGCCELSFSFQPDSEEL